MKRLLRFARNDKTDARGFTLIELLVVISIIGILAILTITNLNSARRKSRDAKRKTDIKSVQAALETYYASNNAYPSGSYSGLSSLLTPAYIPVMPNDPLCPGGSCSGAGANWQNYIYAQACQGAGCTSSQGYKLQAQIENTADPDAKLISGKYYYGVCGGNNGSDSTNCSPI